MCTATECVAHLSAPCPRFIGRIGRQRVQLSLSLSHLRLSASGAAKGPTRVTSRQSRLFTHYKSRRRRCFTLISQPTSRTTPSQFSFYYIVVIIFIFILYLLRVPLGDINIMKLGKSNVNEKKMKYNYNFVV